LVRYEDSAAGGFRICSIVLEDSAKAR